MTTPTEPADNAEEPRCSTVRVPIRRGDSIFSADEYAGVDADAADHWDSRQWRDHPL